MLKKLACLVLTVLLVFCTSVATAHAAPTINDQLVLDATNKAIRELNAGTPLTSLDSTNKSNAQCSCNNFAPMTLENVIDALDNPKSETTEYKNNPANWPNSFPDQSFVNFTMFFNESSSNHNFNVYFKAGNKSYLIQTYVDESIRISTPQSSSEFINLWKQLATNDWAAAYEKLFYVKPKTEGNSYTSQYVTVVTPS